MPAHQPNRRYAYYPGCTLHGLAREYDRTLRAVAAALDIDFEDLPGWNCCGGPTGLVDRQAAVAFARRNAVRLNRARRPELVVACAWCYHNLKTAAAESPDASMAVTHAVELLGAPSTLARLVSLYAERYRDDPEADLLPVPCAAYYGCLLTRPAQFAIQGITPNDGPIERMLRAVNLPVVGWPMRERCCGAWHGFGNPEVARELSSNLLTSAEAAGAKAIVTACPLCHYNLDAMQYEIGRRMERRIYMPIYHFSEVLAYAVAPDVAECEQARHMNSDRAMIDEMLCRDGERVDNASAAESGD